MIQLTYKTDPEAGTLTLFADDEERAAIADLLDEEGKSIMDQEGEALEYLISNSELQWISPSATGDLTDAPILGILGEEQRENSGPYGAVECGQDKDGKFYQPVLERWGFEPYQVRTFLSDLVANGKAVFRNQW
jgi:hypothetical protein